MKTGMTKFSNIYRNGHKFAQKRVLKTSIGLNGATFLLTITTQRVH